MIDDAYAAWNLLRADLGETLYEPTGTLALSSNGADWAERSAVSLASIGKPMTRAGRWRSCRRRFPSLDHQGPRARLLDRHGRRAAGAGHRGSTGASPRNAAACPTPRQHARPFGRSRARPRRHRGGRHPRRRYRRGGGRRLDGPTCCPRLGTRVVALPSRS